jgi:hypothetical protein
VGLAVHRRVFGFRRLRVMPALSSFYREIRVAVYGETLAWGGNAGCRTQLYGRRLVSVNHGENRKVLGKWCVCNQDEVIEL